MKRSSKSCLSVHSKGLCAAKNKDMIRSFGNEIALSRQPRWISQVDGAPDSTWLSCFPPGRGSRRATIPGFPSGSCISPVPPRTPTPTLQGDTNVQRRSDAVLSPRSEPQGCGTRQDTGTQDKLAPQQPAQEMRPQPRSHQPRMARPVQ